MSSIGSGYDLSASQFSPDGRVFQVEYANKAVEASGTVVGLRCKDGVAFAVEKIITSRLYEKGSSKRIHNVDKHIGMAVAGLLADAKQILTVARDEAKQYKYDYGVSIPVKYLADRLSMYMHAYTLYGFVRPFGCQVFLASYEHDGPQLYVVEPSGVNNGYFGCAVGKAQQTAKTEIEKLKLNDMKLEDGIKEAAKIIYQVHDEVKDRMFELELSWVGKNTEGKHEKVPTSVYEDAEKYAKASLEEASDDDEEM
ncbi:unnamed protein product [Didymodactylos carnosus]|uniref:Proteasome subunit alpha type n=1 Tax=Didymodactylos carnosus TaxID=1234261 RepID=A0A813T7A0_9BILA|nr:unnamed protein product [Didymodactylos carnosus]CAF0804371.1 unnamed protein product [Didymodactylos carnosus]CAF3556815.1 unnamed protein product [Didymodactylos carnosus]CAF3589594.1 unnamed protein product [Didymodactylos carnosus]